MTVKVKHTLLEDHKKSLPSTVSTALTWNLPCVTISAVLDVVEIISENVAAAMGREMQRCACLPVCSPCGVWPVHVPHHPLHLMSPTHTHTHTHTHKLPPHLVGKCQQVTWTILQRQFLCCPCDGELWVELPHYTFTSSSLTPAGCRLWINNKWHPSRETRERVQAQEDVIVSLLP